MADLQLLGEGGPLPRAGCPRSGRSLLTPLLPPCPQCAAQITRRSSPAPRSWRPRPSPSERRPWDRWQGPGRVRAAAVQLRGARRRRNARASAAAVRARCTLRRFTSRTPRPAPQCPRAKGVRVARRPLRRGAGRRRRRRVRRRERRQGAWALGSPLPSLRAPALQHAAAGEAMLDTRRRRARPLHTSRARRPRRCLPRPRSSWSGPAPAPTS